MSHYISLICLIWRLKLLCSAAKQNVPIIRQSIIIHNIINSKLQINKQNYFKTQDDNQQGSKLNNNLLFISIRFTPQRLSICTRQLSLRYVWLYSASICRLRIDYRCRLVTEISLYGQYASAISRRRLTIQFWFDMYGNMQSIACKMFCF